MSIMMNQEEGLYVRQGFFKKYIPQIYKDTCCFTEMKMITVHGYNMIDACHIVPFSIGQDDRITNGIALCPNLHRAFDRGLVSIGEDFVILVSSSVSENKNHPYSLNRLQGRKILLPESPAHHPNKENLEWHRKEVFKS
jgi:putative restriction endonuclease